MSCYNYTLYPANHEGSGLSKVSTGGFIVLSHLCQLCGVFVRTFVCLSVEKLQNSIEFLLWLLLQCVGFVVILDVAMSVVTLVCRTVLDNFKWGADIL